MVLCFGLVRPSGHVGAQTRIAVDPAEWYKCMIVVGYWLFCSMKFFIPQVDDPEQTEIVYAAIRKYVAEVTAREILHRRILAINYVHSDQSFHSEVGEIEGGVGEIVVAILQAEDVLLVCTPSRGLVSSLPVVVEADEVYHVSDFET